MRLHQLKLEYVVEQDRLLLHLATDENTEVLLWLTRRCIKKLWMLLIDMAHALPEIASQANLDTRNALLGFRHEAAVSEADFGQSYVHGDRERPLGREPLLVTRLELQGGKQDKRRLGLYPVQGDGVHLSFDEKLLHGFMKLVETGVAKADWDLELRVAPAVLPGYAEGGRPSIN